MDHTGQEGLDPDLAAIRKMMDSTPKRAPSPAAPVASPTPMPAQPELPAPEEIVDPMAGPDPVARPHPKAPSAIRTFAVTMLDRLCAFLARPEVPRLLASVLLALSVVLRPWAVLFMAVLAVVVGLITYFSLGPDRVSEIVVAWYHRMKERDPDRAEQLRARAAKASFTLGRVLDRLPVSWTQGLYLPDFEEVPDLNETLRADPFERLVAQDNLR